MAALGSVSQLVLNLQFVLLQLPKTRERKIQKGGERESPKGKGVKGKANEQTSIFKKFSFSTFFVTCFVFCSPPSFSHCCYTFCFRFFCCWAFAFNVKLLTKLIRFFAALICAHSTASCAV